MHVQTLSLSLYIYIAKFLSICEFLSLSLSGFSTHFNSLESIHKNQIIWMYTYTIYMFIYIFYQCDMRVYVYVCCLRCVCVCIFCVQKAARFPMRTLRCMRFIYVLCIYSKSLTLRCRRWLRTIYRMNSLLTKISNIDGMAAIFAAEDRVRQRESIQNRKETRKG